MKLLVGVKRVVDHNIKVRVKTDKTGVDLAHVKMSMNPFDEIAVEEAVRQKEAGKVEEIIVVSIGPSEAQETLRSALAMGADRAILIQTEQPLESLHVAKILQKLVEKENPHMVFLGKQAIDDDANQTGQMLAALLGWGQGTFASKLVLAEEHADISREIDGGIETLRLKLPAIMTVDLRLNEPRYASLPNIMKAKRKPIEQIDMQTLGLDLTPHLTILEVEEPQNKRKSIRLENAQQLVEKLKQAEIL